MTLYEDYYTQYRAAITKSRLEHKGKHEFIIEPHIWITMKYFEDRKIIPSITSDDIVQAELLSLIAHNEHDMINAIAQTLKDLDEFMGEAE